MTKARQFRLITMCAILLFLINSVSDNMIDALVTYTLPEESAIPSKLGDLLPNVLGNNSNHISAANIMLFPSSQPFSEFFHLINRRRTMGAGTTLISSELQLVKKFDLEKACKKRLPIDKCHQAHQTCCCDPAQLYCSISLQFAVTTEGGPFHSFHQQNPFTVFLVEVRIVDLNDQAPIFTPNEFSLQVSEGESQHTGTYRLPVARDADLGQNANVSYSIVGIFGRAPGQSTWWPLKGGPVHFTLSSSGAHQSLALHIDGEFNREQTESYRLLVEAVDNGLSEIRKSGTLTTIVNVIDINDMSPVFKAGRLLDLEVAENSPLGTVVTKIEATDSDQGPNGEISFRMNGVVPFSLGPTSGLLTVTGELDREQIADYAFVIEAFDHGNPPRTTTLTTRVRVLDVNDNPPTIVVNSVSGTKLLPLTRASDHITVSVPESHLVGSPVAVVLVSDADSNGHELLSCRVEHEMFVLRPLTKSSYSLCPTVPFDYEKNRRYSVGVYCEDAGEPHPLHSKALIKVTVLDEKDYAPVFVQPDIYSPAWRVNESQLSQIFAILPEEINVSINGVVVFLPKPFPPGDTFMRFRIIDQHNENESAETRWQNGSYRFSLHILKEYAFNQDNALVSQAVMYRSEDIVFHLSEFSGELLLSTSPSIDGVMSIYHARVSAQEVDGKPLSSTFNFTLILAESNLHTPMLRIYNFALANSISLFQIFEQESNVTENVVPFYIPLGNQATQVIGQVVGTDPDHGQSGRMTYSLTHQTTDFCFTIGLNSLTGLLSLIPLASEPTVMCQLETILKVTDHGFPQRSTELNVTFKGFDAKHLSPSLSLNAGSEDINITDRCNDRENCSRAIHLHLTQNNTNIFQLKTKSLPGVIEPVFSVRRCDNSIVLPAIEVDKKTGQCSIHLPPAGKAFNHSVFIEVSNSFWPSLSPKIYQTDMQTINSSTLMLIISPVSEVDCNEDESFDAVHSTHQSHFSVFLIPMWTVAGALCFIILILIFLLNKAFHGRMSKRWSLLCSGQRWESTRRAFYKQLHRRGTQTRDFVQKRRGEPDMQAETLCEHIRPSTGMLMHYFNALSDLT